ncbi:steroid hormone receptor ERR2-like [Gordionus sp. m RMFG-2023]|uniref:steroid hormone receptor ERR2-like n=1 Tax=Gordionus sp. m RMFG-2023 TaxID=3053472 RepID=UPI0031FC6F55
MNLAGELDEEMRRRRTLEPEDDDLRSEIMERELIQPDSSTHHIHNSSNFYARNSNNNNKIVSANSGRSHTVANAYNVNGLIKTNHDNIENSVIRNNTTDNIAVSTLNNRETSTNNNHNLCLVCGDVSSGFHYGVASCEACKAFFKRTIQGNIEYRCLLNESCEISKRRRKACQACRLQKCFNVGMLREGVRLDRVRGGRQKYARGFPNVYNSSFTYKKNFQEEQNLINYLKNIQPQNLYDSNEAQILTDREIKSHYNHLDVISALADIELVAMVTWAKQLPDFSKLSLNDQILLFHYSWNEMLLLSFIHRSLPYSGRLHFSPTYSISKSEWSQTPMQELMHAISEVVKIFEINLCKLSVEEFLLLKALLVCNTEGLSKIQGISNISKLRKNLLDCLNHVTLITKCSDPYRISKILLCLPYLRQLDIESRNFWNKIKKEGKVCLRKLFVEMLEAF